MLELTTLPPSCAGCLEIWEPLIPGNFSVCPGLHRDRFLLEQLLLKSDNFEFVFKFTKETLYFRSILLRDDYVLLEKHIVSLGKGSSKLWRKWRFYHQRSRRTFLWSVGNLLTSDGTSYVARIVFSTTTRASFHFFCLFWSSEVLDLHLSHWFFTFVKVSTNNQVNV